MEVPRILIIIILYFKCSEIFARIIMNHHIKCTSIKDHKELMDISIDIFADKDLKKFDEMLYMM